jgi:hypothetical protein
VARDSNSDVNRAMAALAVASMPYRSFADVSPPPVSGRAVQLAADFPLLLAALPEVVLFSIPNPPAAPPVSHDRPERLPLAFEGTTTEAAGVATIAPAAAPDGCDRQSRDFLVASQQAASLAGQTVSLPIDPQVRRAAAPAVPKQRPVTMPLVTIHAERTPLGAVFRTLRAAGPDLEQRHESQSQLQNMFDLL